MERKDYTTTIQDLLKGIDSEFDNTSRRCIKMLRHADSRTKLGKEEEQTKLFINGNPFPTNITSIYALYVYRKDLFLQYQSEQLARNMRNIKYLVSFIGEEKKTARFVGVYKINAKRDNPKVKGEVILDLEQIKAFEHLEKRIVIDWATPTNSWHQYYDRKKQARIEKYIQEQDNVPLFESYLRTNLNHAQLKLVVQHPDWGLEDLAIAITDNSILMYNRECTPERISELKENEIFVFGSNLAGAHGGGAARLAYNRFGAVWGEGVGLHGKTYAIPTMQGGVETIKPM